MSFYIKYKLQELVRFIVLGGFSVVCSIVVVIVWDKVWVNNLDFLGRVVIGVYDFVYEGGEVESLVVSYKEGGEDGLVNLKVGDKVQEVIVVV